MIMTKTDTLPKRRNKSDYSPNRNIIEEFIAMNVPYVILEDGERKAASISASISQSIVRFGYANTVMTAIRNDKAYLINKMLAGKIS